MRFFFLVCFSLTSCIAHAKPTPKPIPVVEVKPLEYVDYDDAKAALEAASEFQRAAADAKVKEMLWQKARGKLIEKYGIDPDQGQGWDVDDHGRLKIRRSAPGGKK